MAEFTAQRVVVFGQGYVGLPLAIRAAEVGHHVIGYDVDDRRVTRLAEGKSFIEDVSDDQINAALASGRYRPTANVAEIDGFDTAVISVPTPLRDGVPDLSYIETAADEIGGLLRRGATVILESTTYPGTTEELVGPILESRSGLVAGTDFALGFSPERIDPGNPTWTLVTTPKVVSGVNDTSLTAVCAFYDTIVDRTVPVGGTREAELAKLVENTFRHVNIALVNELAMFAADLGIDVWEAIDAAATKPFGFMRFTPGPGVGGHCLPIDPSYLSWRVKRSLGQSFRFVELANDVNEHMPDYVVRRLVVALNQRGLAMKGRKILLLGLSYKRNTGDARQSPSAVIIERLLLLGALVRAADPYVIEGPTDSRIERVEATADEVATADAVVLLADHDVFDYEMLVERAVYILDTRHRVSGPNVEYL